MTTTTVSPLHGFELDECVKLAADTRSWIVRSAWHEQRACVGCRDDAYLGDLPPTHDELSRCSTLR